MIVSTAPGAPASRLPIRPADGSSSKAGTSGHRSTAQRSAASGPRSGRNPTIMAAIGASTSRDQCIGVPSGEFTRCWTRSNQPWPARRSRTWTSRMASSGSGSARSARAPSSQSDAAATSAQTANDSQTMRAGATRPELRCPRSARGEGRGRGLRRERRTRAGGSGRPARSSGSGLILPKPQAAAGSGDRRGRPLRLAPPRPPPRGVPGPASRRRPGRCSPRRR